MLTGGSNLGGVPICSDDDSFAGVNSPFYALLREGHHGDIVLLLEVDTAPTMYRAQWSNSGQEWRGKAGDSVLYPNVMRSPFTVEQQLLGGRPFEARSTGLTRYGNVIVEPDPDDDVPVGSLKWDARPFRIYLGDFAMGRSEFGLVAQGTVRDIDYGEDEIALTIEPAGRRFADDLQESLFTGLGGSGGNENLKDRKRPLCFGSRKNLVPVEVDELTFQVHTGRVDDVKPLDGGIDFAPAPLADFPDYATLDAWDPIPGQYVTAKAIGHFKLGNRTGRGLTCDVRGDADPARGGYSDTVAGVVRLICLYAGVPAEDLIGLSQLALDCPYQAGLYLEDGGGSVDDVLEQVLGPLQASRVATPAGQFLFVQARRRGAPFFFNEDAIESARRIGGVRHISRARLRWGQVRQQSDTDLNLFATAERRALVANEWREAVYDNPSTTFLSRLPYDSDSVLQNGAEAAIEIARQVGMSEELPDLWQVVVNEGHLTLYPGAEVRFGFPRSGLPTGRTFIVLSETASLGDGTVALTVWG